MAVSPHKQLEREHVWFLTQEEKHWYMHWIFSEDVDYNIGYYFERFHYKKILKDIKKDLFVMEDRILFVNPYSYYNDKIIFMNKNRIYGLVPTVVYLSDNASVKKYFEAI